MSSVKKPQKTFIALLLSALIVVQGKANFRNMSRYSPMSEKRFQRWYPKVFDCVVSRMLDEIFLPAKQEVYLISDETSSILKASGSYLQLRQYCYKDDDMCQAI